MRSLVQPAEKATGDDPSHDRRLAAHQPIWLTGGILALVALLYWVVRQWGNHISETQGRTSIRLGSPPFVGFDDVRIGVGTLIPIVVGLALVLILPLLASRLAWHWVVVVGMVSAAAWAIALAVIVGWDGVTDPLIIPENEYLLDVPKVGDPLTFLSNFTANIDDYVVHVRSHPPGFILTLWTADTLGWGGTGSAAVLCIGGGASAVGAVLLSLKRIAGEQVARLAMPFMVLTPAAIWVATTADAYFAGVSAWSISAVIFATYSSGRRAIWLGALGGLGMAYAMTLNYGAFLLWAVPGVVALHRRNLRPVMIAAATALAALLSLWLVSGFSYIDGMLTTRVEYAEQSVARTRPYRFFLFVNLAALALMLGPAIVVALTRLRDRFVWVVVVGALLAVAFAEFSGMSKGEVERIWLQFAVWILPAGAALASSGRSRRVAGWLLLQVGVALAIASFIRTMW